MASIRSLSLFCSLPLFAQSGGETHATQLHALLNRAPRLALTRTRLPVHPPAKEWELGMVSWVAMDPKGVIFISDGYANARVLEYTGDGNRVREWGEPGMGPGQFHLLHSIQIDENGVIYVADRENGRIQRFDLEGHYLGEWSHHVRTFSLTLRGGSLYIATQPLDQPNGSPGWLMKLDPKTGHILGYVESTGNHGIEVAERGELLIAPGPGEPQWFR